MEITKLFEKFHNQELPLEDLIEELRNISHALDETTRHKAVELFSQLPEQNAQRELLQLYQTTHWRDTKMRIIKNLWRFPSNRTIEFLVQLARNEHDLAISEEAIWSLGRSQHPIAARFLVRFYEFAPDVIKPFLVSAIGQINDHTLVDVFTKELPAALKSNNINLAKNLILTLADLKASAALPIIEPLIHPDTHKSILFSAVIAYAKLARDDKKITAIEEIFRNDLFEFELIRSAKNQLRFRADWTLEDYLKKAFENNASHPMLPFELNTFENGDVETGLQFFTATEHHEKLCDVLSKLHFKNVSSWYEQCLREESFLEKNATAFLKSIQKHSGVNFEKIILNLENFILSQKNDSLLDEWLLTIALCVPQAEKTFTSLAENHNKSLSNSQKILFINALVVFGITNIFNQKVLKQIGKSIEEFLETNEPTVQARALRALGQIGFINPGVLSFIKENVKNEKLTDSILFYAEKCPSKQSAELLLELSERGLSQKQKYALLKSISTQNDFSTKDKRFETFLSSSLNQAGDLESQRLALACLIQIPVPQFQKEVIELFKATEQIKIHAIIAAKSIKVEAFAEPIAEVLNSKSSLSVLSRALDTLTALPGLRAKSLVVDYLEKNLQNTEACEKIIRSVEAPQSPNPGLAQRIQKIMETNKNSQLADGLLQLRDRFATGLNQTDLLPKLNEKEVEQIDAILKKRIQHFANIDEQAKATLRAAELPFIQTQMYEGSIDKSMSVILYCKALDILLDKHFGKKHLIPKLESKLQQFQNSIHLLGLNNESVNAQFVMRALRVEHIFTYETFPLNKMLLLSKDFLNGKILSTHWKSVDGLRAWASLLLLFSRNIEIDGQQKSQAIIPLKETTDDEVAKFCKRLLLLQDARNPVAHRQTLLHFADVEKVRDEATVLLGILTKVLLA